jgi:hypothetical protein
MPRPRKRGRNEMRAKASRGNGTSGELASLLQKRTTAIASVEDLEAKLRDAQAILETLNKQIRGNADWKALQAGLSNGEPKRRGRPPGSGKAAKAPRVVGQASEEEILSYFKKNPNASVGSCKKALDGRAVATRPLVEAGLLKKTGGRGTGVTFKVV